MPSQRSDSCFYATYRAFINCFSSSSSDVSVGIDNDDNDNNHEYSPGALWLVMTSLSADVDLSSNGFSSNDKIRFTLL